ncbi:hypothetical protein SUGI_0057580 [Cryptomeria japonica]|nr:hypothetical protein SUGI_0057580 [Cryptomeria japonica]
MQRAEEADRDYKKLCGRLSEDFEEIQATFTEIIAEAQSSDSRLCKTSFLEILNSTEKSLEGLCSRYAHQF